ncbi:MAG: nitrogenase component 1, partial [Pseudomonadota bacterium]
AHETERLSWYSLSIDSTYLTGKRVFIFGDGTHALAAARVAKEELGFEVCGLGTYSREFAREVRALAADYGVEPLITDDHLAVEDAIIAAQPELVLGTQMERHVAKRLRLPCAVISSPVHVQDFPARHSPQMGWEGANVLFDTWVHPLMMGLEEHLLGMFREDFEFNDASGGSHLAALAPQGAPQGMPQTAGPEALHDVPQGASHGAHGTSNGAASAAEAVDSLAVAAGPDAEQSHLEWAADAERELKKIPFFVRGKARRNTESFADAQGIAVITVETLYDAKAHYGR